MHELPSDLTNSLRSWRGSKYGSNDVRDSKPEPDLERAVDSGEKEYHEKALVYGDKEYDDYSEAQFERALRNKNSSLILHPTASRTALNQVAYPKEYQNGSQDQITPVPYDSQSQMDKRSYMQRPSSISHQSHAQIKKPAAPKSTDPDPAADRLDDDPTPLTKADFYELMGMQPPTNKSQNPSQLASRHGLYGRLHYELEYTQTKYRIYDILVYVFLILQLFLSAVFIVLGSLVRVDAHIAIAILGAVSTVIAGALALMKGQGLPNRLRQTRDSLRNVVFEAEELYWDVGADRPVYYRDVKKVREDYLKVLEASRRNHPDTWNATATGIAQGITASTAKGKGPTLAPGATPKVK